MEFGNCYTDHYVCSSEEAFPQPFPSNSEAFALELLENAFSLIVVVNRS